MYKARPYLPLYKWHKTRLSPARRAGYTVGSFAIKVGNSPAPSICRVADAPLKKTPAFGGPGKTT